MLKVNISYKIRKDYIVYSNNRCYSSDWFLPPRYRIFIQIENFKFASSPENEKRKEQDKRQLLVNRVRDVCEHSRDIGEVIFFQYGEQDLLVSVFFHSVVHFFSSLHVCQGIDPDDPITFVPWIAPIV